MDEAALAKGLEGKFFWEGTTKYDPDMSKDCLEIRRMQRKYIPKEVAYKPPENWWKVKKEPVNLKEKIDALRSAVSVAFGVPEESIRLRSRRNNGENVAKSFFMWALCRYFPDASLVSLGKYIERHHSTIIHGREEFRAVEHLYKDLIEKMDAYMGYVPG